ncbi:hypothetical protein SAMN04487917_102587 [Arthrobacter sp. yr096]|uniref:hypothetical protein n=1 Tax=unclassified Arthrobacter TaxID=235627 RepID=UPI00089CAB43|nr:MULTISPECIES: hypothetical protein [unclassified Arthrobacter]SDV99655.1 hypothetical protein SAMN04487912_1019 [Arthrobacter sp. cf158]SEI84080.1 hypothetical protein SAMN04487917_102587 [Arthrobacter sp. yr096]
MCYAYYDDFERRTKKDSARKPETHTSDASKDEAPAGKRPQTEGTLWTFLARRRREFEVSEPKIDRIREKV